MCTITTCECTKCTKSSLFDDVWSTKLPGLLQHLNQRIGDRHPRESLLTSMCTWLWVSSKACHQREIQIELLHQPILDTSSMHINHVNSWPSRFFTARALNKVMGFCWSPSGCVPNHILNHCQVATSAALFTQSSLRSGAKIFEKCHFGGCKSCKHFDIWISWIYLVIYLDRCLCLVSLIIPCIDLTHCILFRRHFTFHSLISPRSLANSGFFAPPFMVSWWL